MTATTSDRNTKRRDGVDFSFPVGAAKTIHVGTIVALNAGNAEEASTATGLVAVGVAQELADNSGGSAGDVNVLVRRGVWAFVNSASTDELTLSDVGSTCYLVDNQTVAKTDGTSTRSEAGVVRDVNDDGVWVEF